MDTRIAAPEPSNASLILLHGLGETADRFISFVDELKKWPTLDAVNYVLVQAPVRPVTWRKGRPMTRWFDVEKVAVYTLEEHTNDTQGVSESLRRIDKVIEDEVQRGIPRERIIVGGFSMGAAMTLAHAVSSEHKLGAYVCMSGFLPAWEYLESIASHANLHTPILVIHGTADPAARLVTIEAALTLLRERFGFGQLEYVRFEGMRHRIEPQCQVVASFIERILGKDARL